jgi:hypothetical protein
MHSFMGNLREDAARVRVDHDLGAVIIETLEDRIELVLCRGEAINMTLKLIGAINRLYADETTDWATQALARLRQDAGD